MKNLFLFILAMLPMVAFANDDGVCGDYATYHYEEQNHTLTISGFFEMYNYSSADEVPWQSYKDKINKVVIESGITSIGNNAFAGCSGLFKISIPNSIYRIEEAFQNCYNLKEITIPESVSYLSAYLYDFDGNKLDCNIIMLSSTPPDLMGQIPNGMRVFVPDEAVETYMAGEFWSYQNILPMSKLEEYRVKKMLAQDGIFYKILSEEQRTCEVTRYSYTGDINIPETVTDDDEDKTYTVVGIDSAAFENAELNSISLPSSILKIGKNAFYRCKGLSQLAIPSKIQYIEEEAFAYSDIINVHIPRSCLIIGKEAFQYSLIENFSYEFQGSFTRPTTLMVIEDYAFWNCQHLSTVNLGATLLDISKNNPFGLCNNLSEIEGWGVYIDDENGYSIKDGCLYRFSEKGNNLELICCPGGKKTWTAPEHLKSIGNRAFSGCSEITNIDIPNSVKTIGDYAFFLVNGSYDSIYRRVYIPESVEDVGRDVWGWFSKNLDIYLDNTKIPYFRCSFLLKNGTLHIPYGKKELYDIEKLNRNFYVLDDIGDDYITIEDGTIFDNDFVRENTALTYSRTFSSTQWQSLYVPFAIPVDSLTKQGLQVAELNDTHQWDLNGDGVADSTRVEFFTLTSGSTLANYPYLIRANDAPKTFTLRMEDVEVSATEENSYECSSFKQRFTVVGTYAGVTGQEMWDNNYYGMSGGGLKRVSNATVSLKPQRWYMKVENKNGDPVTYYAASLRIAIDGIDEMPEATDIEMVCGANGEAVIYGIDGMRYRQKPSKPGLYVQGGKKIFIR